MGEEVKRERESNRELNHYSNIINDSPICMRWTINHSQVSVTDRRLAFSAANRMNFDNINGIPLFFPALIHCAACVCAWMCVCCVVRRMPVSLWLSNYRQNLLTHLSRRKEARRAEEKKRGKSLITLACSTVRSLIKPSYLPVTPSQRASLSHICTLSSIKYLGIFFLWK